MGFLILGMIVCSTANVMNVFIGKNYQENTCYFPLTILIGGMSLTGIGAGMSER